MTALVWDEVGSRTYEGGIERGVLYLQDGTAVPWNGLTGVEEDPTSEVKSYYLEGVKYLQTFSPSEFEGKLKAFTYPEEFDRVSGIGNLAPGLDIHDQPAKSFSLSYRTRIGSDVSPEHGYKIHLLYNVIANPDTFSFDTLQAEAQPTEFAWSLTGTPTKLKGFRPTVHISIDSTQTPPEVMKVLEDQLYGTASMEPSLPSISTVAGYFGYLGELIILDHGDGTWTAVDGSNTYILMLDDTTFQIHDADATYLDADTYTISNTSP
jgi:hypothetical protein